MVVINTRQQNNNTNPERKLDSKETQ